MALGIPESPALAAAETFRLLSQGKSRVDILGGYADVIGVEEVQLDFWSDDFLMRQAVLDISHVDGSGSPVSTKVSVFFHGYGEAVVIDAPEIVSSEIAPDEDFLSLLAELEFLQPAGLGGPELPVQGCSGRR